jgi:hypothetical protein
MVAMGGPTRTRLRRLLAAAVMMVAALSVAGCGAQSAATYKAPDLATMQRDTAGLRGVLPSLEELQVVKFDNLPNCRGLTMGQIWSEPAQANCGFGAVWVGPKGPRPFTLDVSAAHTRIAEAIAGSGAAIPTVEGISFDVEGKLTVAEFVLSEDYWNRWSYFYEPGYTLPMQMRGSPDYTAIDSDWYYRHNSWH